MGVQLPSEPITRKEQYLAKAAGQAVEIPAEPITREEAYLDAIAKGSGGGGGGTSDYSQLSNKPQINGTTLTGNKSASDLGLVAAVDGKGLSENDYTDADKAIVGGVTAALADKADKSAVKNEFIGTTDEWNALTTAQKKEYDTYQITNDYTEGSGSLPDYSTTEQKTGQKWIDGKDIYFKTLSTTISITVNDQWIDTGLSGIDSLIDYNIRMTREGIQVGNTFLGGIINATVLNNTFKVLAHNLDTVDHFVITSITAYYTKTA